MLQHPNRDQAYFDCIAALDGNCAGRAHAPEPSCVWLASFDQARHDGSSGSDDLGGPGGPDGPDDLGNAEKHRSSAGWQLY